jgi:ribosomal-protein-alanine N-acetyltransferase
MYINKICLPENYTSLFFLDLHERFPETFIVAEVNEEVVGYIMCRIETGFANSSFGITKKGHVVSIAVLPEYRGYGIGHALIEEAIKGMQKYNVKEIYLEVRVSNTTAINLYRKLGLEIRRIIKEYYLDGEDAYLMAKKL